VPLQCEKSARVLPLNAAENGGGLVAAGHFVEVVYLIILKNGSLHYGDARREGWSVLCERVLCAKGGRATVCATCVITLAITPTLATQIEVAALASSLPSPCRPRPTAEGL